MGTPQAVQGPREKKAPHPKKKLALNSSLKAGDKQQETCYEKQLSSPSKHGLMEKLSYTL